MGYGATLQYVEGPPCPACGCRDCKILEFPQQKNEDQNFFAGGNPDQTDKWKNSPWWSSGRARCNHCSSVFSFREIEKRNSSDPQEEKKPTSCPECNGSRYYVYKTKGEKKYRKCRDCGFTKD